MLRFSTTCTQCGTQLSPTSRAHWDKSTHSAICLRCLYDPQLPTVSDEAQEQQAKPPEVINNPTSTGEAGQSAQMEYERRHQKRMAAIDSRFGRWSGLVKFLFHDPQSTRAWQNGALGERIVAEYLTEKLEGKCRILNDRKVPGTRGNIDHIAVASSGVWVIDSKRYAGKLKRINNGAPFRKDYRLHVNGRDRTKLVTGLEWQAAAVRKTLADSTIPVHSALCFVDAEWGIFLEPFQIDGTWVTHRKKLAEIVTTVGPIERDAITAIASLLESKLPQK